MEFLNTPASLCDPSCMVKINGEYIDRFNWLSDPQHIRRVHEDITEEGAINPEYVHCSHKGANRACPHGSEKPYCIYRTKMDIPL